MGRPLMQVVMALAAAMLAAVCGAQPSDTAGAVAALRARHDELRPQLIDNAFHRPLYLSSSETGDHVEGDAYAELDQPFAAFAPAFKSVARVCDVLFLHLNAISPRPGARRSASPLSTGRSMAARSTWAANAARWSATPCATTWR